MAEVLANRSASSSSESEEGGMMGLLQKGRRVNLLQRVAKPKPKRGKKRQSVATAPVAMYRRERRECALISSADISARDLMDVDEKVAHAEAVARRWSSSQAWSVDAVGDHDMHKGPNVTAEEVPTLEAASCSDISAENAFWDRIIRRSSSTVPAFAYRLPDQNYSSGGSGAHAFENSVCAAQPTVDLQDAVTSLLS